MIAPAVALARDGFVLAAGDELLPDGKTPLPGTRFRQPQLARTLELVAKDGPGAFYQGPIARTIVAASRANGGILTMDDFAGYRVEEAPPLHCSFDGYEIIGAPPPSSGGVTLCEILNIIAPYPLARWGRHDAMSIHYVTEAERLAYADRNAYLGDPDFVHDPVAQLLAPEYAARLRAKIKPERATLSADVHPGLSISASEGADTTHYSIVDRWGTPSPSLTRSTTRSVPTSRPAIPASFSTTRWTISRQNRACRTSTGLCKAVKTQSRLGSGRFRRWRRPSSRATANSQW